jgi:hypothetical protein
MRKLHLILACVAVAGCGEEDVDDGIIGNDYAQCEGLGTDASAATQRARDVHLPAGVAPNCATKTGFTFQNQTYELVYAAYGALQDCPAGCFSSMVCALDDGSTSRLFYATWYGDGERPPSIATECPALANSAGGDTAYQCTNPQVSGRQHAIVQDPTFRNFLLNNPAPVQFGRCGLNLP